MTYPNRPFRYQTHIPVHIARPGEPQIAYIVDINEGGACVAGISGVTVGEAIMMRDGDETNVATIRWAANNRAGVFFDRPIPTKDLNIMRYRDPAYVPPSQSMTP